MKLANSAEVTWTRDPGNLWTTQVIRTSIILDLHGRGVTMQTLGLYGAGTASRERADAKEMSPAFLPKKKKKEKFVKINKSIINLFEF